jgi:hypothetical protein
VKQSGHYHGGWHAIPLPAAATDRAFIDAKTQALLAQVIDAIIKLGLVTRQPADASRSEIRVAGKVCLGSVIASIGWLLRLYCNTSVALIKTVTCLLVAEKIQAE